MTALKAAIFSDSSEKQKPHAYNCHRLLCYYSGEGKMQLQDKKYPVGINSVIYIPPAVSHSDYAEKSELEYISILFETDTEISNGNALFIENDSSFYSELRQIVVCNQLGSPAYARIRDSLLDAVINKLILFGKMSKDELAVFKYEVSIVETIAKSERTITDFMNCQDITRSNISRRFKTVTDETAKKFMDDQKIEYAKQLMLHDSANEKSTEDIARLCGYEEEYYFSRIFKNKTGMSIAEFIRKKNS